MEAHQLPSGTYLEQNKYYIERVLGDGGFGITYLGYDVKLQRKVAIKEFYMRGYCYRNPGDPNVYTEAGEKRENFEKMKRQYIEEGRVLAALGEQPGVVNVYTFIEENNTAYLVMDFVEGQSLDAYVKGRGGRLSVSETLAIMRPVIRALAGVHKRGVIHRDISPDNIMITHDRKVKLIDFGAARMYGNYNYLRVQKGGYSPIEQVTPGAQIGPYSDVYALCATMYTCMTGVKVPHAVERAKQDRLVPPSAMGLVIAPQVETPERKFVYQIQTPQTFQVPLLRRAYETMYEAKRNGDTHNITDDTMLVEQYAGVRCKVVEGAYENIKITTPEDLAIAEIFVEKTLKKF